MSYEDAFLKRLDTTRHAETKERRSGNRDGISNLVKMIVPQEYASASAHLKESALKLGAFKDLYGFENIGRDMERVKHLESIFDKNDQAQFSEDVTFGDIRKLSEITESYLLRGINESNWIPYCNAIKTSAIDDYDKGIDIVLEYQKGEEVASHIGLGIDVTFSMSLEKKLRNIKADITSNTLPNLKYFDSPKSHIRGELKNVSRGIVAFDHDTIARLARQRQSSGKLSPYDPARLTTLRQLDLQFATYVEYGESINSKSLPALKRSANFVKLLYTYVYQHTENPDRILSGNAQIINLNRSLSHFAEL